MLFGVYLIGSAPSVGSPRLVTSLILTVSEASVKD